MPVMRYFIYVGGALLALLFIANASMTPLPTVEGAQSAVDLSIVRIHSDRKWPERVVFDTTLPTITPAPVPVASAVAEPPPPPQRGAAAAPLKSRVREAYAQWPARPAQARNSETKWKRKSVARDYPGSPRMLVAQQRPVFLFGNNVW
jgi:hypothetical protein